ncbi:MAG: hypothetical protein NZM11_12960, partial [Anaerolineales bacterium]|nr:hypothetical protein [Anaerolineales bacterium]
MFTRAHPCPQKASPFVPCYNPLRNPKSPIPNLHSQGASMPEPTRALAFATQNRDRYLDELKDF